MKTGFMRHAVISDGFKILIFCQHENEKERRMLFFVHYFIPDMVRIRSRSKNGYEEAEILLIIK